MSDRATRRPGPIAVAVGLLVVAGLALFAVGALGRTMQPPDLYCALNQFSTQRCNAIVDQGVRIAGLPADAVTRVELGAPDGRTASLGGQLVAVARITLADGQMVDAEVWCVGVGGEYRPWCSDDPAIELWTGANHDVPCSGDTDPPSGCATPIALDPATVAQARPLVIDAVDVPASVGHHEILLGSAWLANGYLDEATFALADPAPDGIAVPDGIRMEVRPTDPARPPFMNVYDRGVIPGLEEATAWLVFDVEASPEGAVLQVRDVLVR